MARTGAWRATSARTSSETFGAKLVSTALAWRSSSIRFTVSDANTPSKSATPATDATISSAPAMSAGRESRRRRGLGSAHTLHDFVKHFDAEAQIGQRNMLVVAVH